MYKNKLLITAGLLIITASFFVIACARTNEKSETSRSLIVIGERMFATQVRDIYLNAEDYLGRTVKLEGIFRSGQINQNTIYYVIRYFQDGCCDGISGFEVRWAQPELGSAAAQYPADDSWVEAAGVLTYERGYLYLALTSLLVLDRRGAEFVRQ